MKGKGKRILSGLLSLLTILTSVVQPVVTYAAEPEPAGYEAQYPAMETVREYLEFAAGLKRIPGGERAAQLDRILEMTRTADVSGRLIRNLSNRPTIANSRINLHFPGFFLCH